MLSEEDYSARFKYYHMGFGLMIGFSERLWLVTTSNYNTIANLCT
jgi:hypothetical protein